MILLLLIIIIIAVALMLQRSYIKTGSGDDDYIIFVTGNVKKCEEVKQIINMDIRNKQFDLPEIQSVDVHEVIKEKLKTAKTLIERGQRLCVEDTSLSIKNAGENIRFRTDFPGALIKFYMAALSDIDICKLHGGSEAVATTCVGYIDKNGAEHYFTGSIDGYVSEYPRGDNGFGWDKIFVPKFVDAVENKLTFAEMTTEQKNSISMRRSAFVQMANHIKSK